MLLIVDASVIIAFYSKDELDAPQLLHQLSSKGCKLIIPLAVLEEIQKGRKPTIEILSKAVESGIISVNREITTEETIIFRKLHPRLDDGEIQVLLLGLKYKALGTPYFCLVDEDPGRHVADRISIATKGTKGLIALLNEKQIIDKQKMESLLYRLNHCNFRA
jgi:predicted nucleic acid-binding protein